jgi:hypothetical protein
VNDKLAILGELAASRYFLLVEHHLSRYAANIGVDFHNTERDLAMSLQEGKVCVWQADWSLSHALWDSTSGTYCHRSYDHCVPDEVAVQVAKSKCPTKAFMHINEGVKKRVKKATAFYQRTSAAAGTQ